jgi:hypothetical protein
MIRFSITPFLASTLQHARNGHGLLLVGDVSFPHASQMDSKGVPPSGLVHYCHSYRNCLDWKRNEVLGRRSGVRRYDLEATL